MRRFEIFSLFILGGSIDCLATYEHTEILAPSAINKGKKHRSTELEGIGLEKNMRSMSISAGRNEELVSDSID